MGVEGEETSCGGSTDRRDGRNPFLLLCASGQSYGFSISGAFPRERSDRCSRGCVFRLGLVRKARLGFIRDFSVRANRFRKFARCGKRRAATGFRCRRPDVLELAEALNSKYIGITAIIISGGTGEAPAQLMLNGRVVCCVDPSELPRAAVRPTNTKTAPTIEDKAEDKHETTSSSFGNVQREANIPVDSSVRGEPSEEF